MFFSPPPPPLLLSLSLSVQEEIERQHRHEPFAFGILLGDNFYRSNPSVHDGVLGPDDPRFQDFEAHLGGLGIPIYVILGSAFNKQKKKKKERKQEKRITRRRKETEMNE